MCFEILVDGWRKMHAPRNGFKILDVEFIRIKISVPAHNVEWMCSINEIPYVVFLLHFYKKFSFFVVRSHKSGCNDISFAKRRMFQKLPKLIPVSFGGVDGGVTFHYQKNRVLGMEFHLVNRTSWDNQIVPKSKVEVSHKSFQNTGTCVYIQHFITFRIFIKIFSGFTGFCKSHLQVVVQHQNLTAVQEIILRSHVHAFKHTGSYVFLNRHLRSHVFGRADAFNLRRAVYMV